MYIRVYLYNYTYPVNVSHFGEVLHAFSHAQSQSDQSVTLELLVMILRDKYTEKKANMLAV